MPSRITFESRKVEGGEMVASEFIFVRGSDVSDSGAGPEVKEKRRVCGAEAKVMVQVVVMKSCHYVNIPSVHLWTLVLFRWYPARHHWTNPSQRASSPP